MVIRKLGNSVTPVVELTKKDDMYVLSSHSTFKNTSIEFKLNEEFDEDTPDGRKVKSIITQEGNKLLQTQKDNKITTTIVREFEPEQLKMVNLPKNKSNTPPPKIPHSSHPYLRQVIAIIYYDKMYYYFYRP